MRISLFILLTSPYAFAQDFPSWTIKGDQFLKDGQPRLLIAVSDLEPSSRILTEYRKAGLDAVWVRSLLNDTPEGIRETLDVAQGASMSLIGGLPIPNLNHLQVERIRRYAKEPVIAAWHLSSSDAENLKAAKDADPDTLFLVHSDSREELPDRTGSFQSPYQPIADAGRTPPDLMYTSIHETSDAAALGLLIRLVRGGDGLVFSVNYKGVAIGETRVEWLKSRIPLLRQFYQRLISKPWKWESVKTPEGLVALKLETAAGDFFYCRSEKKEKTTLLVEQGELVLYQGALGGWKDGKISFDSPGEIWLGPKAWHDRITKLTESAAQRTAQDDPPVDETELTTIQSSMERQFEFTASVLVQLSKEQFEYHFPDLLPKFKKYYGDQITPLTKLKTADGNPFDIGDMAIAAEAESLGEGKKEDDNLGTQGMTGPSDLPLLRRIKNYREQTEKKGDLEPLLHDLLTLQADFQSACLRWESAEDGVGKHLLQPIGESELAGGLLLLNFSNDPVEMLLADGGYEQELWTSSLFSLESETASAAATQKLTEKNSGVQPFGKTLVVNYSQGYTVVIPPGAQREFMISKEAEGGLAYVALNRNLPWSDRRWSRGADEELAIQPGSGTKFFVEPKLSKPPVLWTGELWRSLDTLSLPPEKREPVRELKTHLYKGEWQTIGFSIHNPNDAPMPLLALQDLPIECTMMAFAYTRAQILTLHHNGDVMLDPRYGPPGRPIPEGPVNGNLIYLNSMGEFWVPPHETRQVFLIFKANKDTPAGDHKGQLHLIDPFDAHKLEPIALEVKVWPMSLPPKSSFKGTGFTIGSAIYRPKNAQDAYDHYFNHLVTTTALPKVSIDWEKEEFVVGNVPEKAKEVADFKSCLRLAPKGFTFFLSGWGATGMDMKYGGIGGFIDQSIREQNAAAENEDAKTALTELGVNLKDDGKEEAEEENDKEFEGEIEEEEEEEDKPKNPAELLREKAERIKKKYWPGTTGYEKLSQQVYKKAIDFYLEQGFKPEHLLSYVWDEAPRYHFPSVVRMAELMKEVHPNIRTYVTCLENLSDYKSKHVIDIYTPHMGHVYDMDMETDAVGHAVFTNDRRNASNLKRYQDTGREIWIYMQHGGYLQGKHPVDYPMGLLWRAWQMDLAGCGIFSIRHCRGDLGFYPTKCYEAWREGVEDFLAMRALEADLKKARKKGIDKALIKDAERTLREHSQEVLGMQWWWSDMARRYRVIRAARKAIAEIHQKLIEKLSDADDERRQ